MFCTDLFIPFSHILMYYDGTTCEEEQKMIIPATYENLQVTHEGTMSKRAYYIPASTRRDDLVEHRERSDRFQLLNGVWKFKYYPNVHDLTDLFYELGFSTEDYDTIPVPSVWQNHGYDQHQYTNIRYPSGSRCDGYP